MNGQNRSSSKNMNTGQYNTLDYDLRGERGFDGLDGLDGHDGVQSTWQRSRNGQNGGHGSPARPGQAGGWLRLDLSTTKNNNNLQKKKKKKHESGDGNDGDDLLLHVTAEGYDQDTNREVFKPGTDHTFPLKEFQKIQWNVSGGHGGHGGNGGNGGHGADGRDGKDANEWRNAEDGEDGGNGGNGGSGTDGGRGGDGGTVNIYVKDEESYLLMLIEGSENPGPRIKGGTGGSPGRHGAGGQCGSPGKGGSSYEYIKTKKNKKYNPLIPAHARTSLEKNKYKYKHKYKPAGANGRSGKRGHPPISSLSYGQHGADGTFAIIVNHAKEKGLEQEPSKSKYKKEMSTTHSSRYDLVLASSKVQKLSSFHCESAGNGMPKVMYEFGETLHVTNVLIANVGGIISCRQSTVILPNSAKSANASSSTSDNHMILSTRIPPGGTSQTDKGDGSDFLKFVVDKPSSLVLSHDDFDPISMTCQLSYRAIQMGGPTSSFMMKEYSNFHSLNNEPCIAIQYPIQNTSGIVGLKSMRGGETTRIKFDLINISTQPIGSNEIGVDVTTSAFCEPQESRRLFVAFKLCPDDKNYVVDSDGIVFRDFQKNKEAFSLKGKSYALPTVEICGHVYEVPLISGSMSSLSLDYSLELRKKKIKGFERARIQAEIYLQDIKQLRRHDCTISSSPSSSFSLIQRRQHVISCQPGFKDLGDAAQVVLVTNSSTTRSQYMEWCKILGPNLMGLKLDVLSLDLYGSLDPMMKINNKDKTRTLCDALKNKLVILFNDTFYPWSGSTDQRNIECRPSMMLCSHISMFDKSTHWLIVGGDADDLSDFDSTSPIRAKSFMRKSKMLPIESKDNSGANLERGCQIPEKVMVETDCSFPNCKSFRSFGNKAVKLEQRNGSPENAIGSRLTPGNKVDEKQASSFLLDDPNCSIITVKSNCLLRPKKDKAERILLKRAKKLKKYLQRRDTLRRYIIDVIPNADEGLKVENAVWWKRNVGELHIHRGVSRRDDEALFAVQQCLQQHDLDKDPIDADLSRAGCLQGDNASRKTLIQSLATLQGIVSALPLKNRLDSYCFAIKNMAEYLSISSNQFSLDQLVGVINNALTKSVLNDMVVYYDGRITTSGNVKENVNNGGKQVQFRSPTLFMLGKHVGLNQLVSSSGSKPLLQKIVSRVLSSLIGHLRCVVSSKDMAPWWSPFSRKHYVRRVFTSDLHRLERSWSAILDDELVRQTQSTVVQQVKDHIKIDRNKFFLRCRQRWRAGLSYVHSPEKAAIFAQKNRASSTSPSSKMTATMSSTSSFDSDVKMFGQESLASIGAGKPTDTGKRPRTTKNVFHQHKRRKCTPVIFDTKVSDRIHTLLSERSKNANSVYRRFQDDRSNLILSNSPKERSSTTKRNGGSSRRSVRKPKSKKKKVKIDP